MGHSAMRPILKLVARRRNRLVVYGLAIILALAAALVRQFMTPMVADLLPFATHFLAVLASAAIGGWRPAALTWGLLAFLTWFTELHATFLDARTQTTAFALYSIASFVMVVLVEASRRAGVGLRRTEGRFATALRASRMGTWCYEGASGKFMGDATFNRICGLSEDFGGVLLDDYLALVVAEDRDDVQRHLEESLRQGTNFDMEFRISPPEEGGVKWVYARGQLMGEEEGDGGELFGVLADISRRKFLEEESRRAEQALHEAETLFRTAQEMSLDGFALLRAVRDDAGAIRDFEWEYANPMAHRLLDHRPGSLVGRPMSEMLPGYFEQGLFERFVHVVETGEALDFELYYRADGVDGHFHNKATKLGDRVVAQFSDITARKREEEERAASLEGRKLLLQELNHRTKNSLQIIAALVHLQASRSGNELVKEHLEQVRQRIMTIAAIHTRLYRDTDQDSEISLLDIGEYLQQLCDMLRNSLLDQGGRIAITLDAASVKIHLDLVIPLGIIVNELVTNALKYAFPGDRAGVITVSFQEVEGGWQLSVTDNGVGISDDAEVTGTGMRMVQALVRQVGGNLGELPGPGHGVAVFLPASEVQQWQEEGGRRTGS